MLHAIECVFNSDRKCSLCMASGACTQLHNTPCHSTAPHLVPQPRLCPRVRTSPVHCFRSFQHLHNTLFHSAAPHLVSQHASVCAYIVFVEPEGRAHGGVQVLSTRLCWRRAAMHRTASTALSTPAEHLASRIFKQPPGHSARGSWGRFVGCVL